MFTGIRDSSLLRPSIIRHSSVRSRPARKRGTGHRLRRVPRGRLPCATPTGLPGFAFDELARTLQIVAELGLPVDDLLDFTTVVDDPWRDPTDHLELLQGAPHQKLRIGPFRLGCRADRDGQVLYVLTIKKRGGDAYRGDD